MGEASGKKYEIDMCSGPLTGKILLFYIPLMFSGILQLMFNAADIVVVGQFAGNEALAAVGSTGSLTNLIINLFLGLSVGANVLVARFYGAGQDRELKEMVQTAIATAFGAGVVLIFVGFLVSRPALALMGTPEDVISHSVLYMRIYFAGMPFMMVYNFGSAVLRAVGDTRRPLYYLMLAGVVNVLLNLAFVVWFSMGVAGVAAATVISQAISAVLVVRCLVRTDSAYRLVWEGMRIYPDKLVKMVRIGIPAGMQGALFSISNVLIQSSVNSFGSTVMAGNTAGSNIEGFVYTAMNSLHQAAIRFCGQNYGARKFRRIGRVMLICEILVVAVGLIMGNGAYFFAGQLLGLYSPDLWHCPHELYLCVLFSLRHDGCGCGCSAGHGLCHHAHAGVPHRGLPPAGGVDLYHFSELSHAGMSVYLLSDQLGSDFWGAYGVFCSGVQEAFEKQ